MSATEGSPKWKNPSDVMKVRNIKRRTLARRKTIHDPTELSSALLNSRSACHRPVSKRKNPFGCTSDHNKRPNHGNNLKEDPKEFFKALDVVNERENDASICEDGSSHNPHATSDGGDGERSLANFQDEQKWQTSEGSPRRCAVKLTSAHAVNRNEQLHDTELSELVADQPTMKTNSPHPRVQCHKHLPLDWSLKVKMRIVSKASLAWCTQLKMSEEARALSQHVQGQQQWHSDADRTSAFHSCCLYWVHPSIPWIKPFPRIVAEQKISHVSIVGSNDEATLALHRDWTDSLTSVFHLLRAGKCPYFYLCTHQFTVLFRAVVGVNSQTNINACLTPTTRGLREAFKQDGISFRMPNLEGKKLELSAEIVSADQNTDPVATSEPDHTPGPHRTACSYGDEDDDDLIDNDEGASVWLESMGLDKKSFPSLDPKKVKLQREGFRRVDNRPESLVYVEGADVQAMFNFLLNCRSCTATSGPQAGVPPTILAPTPFKGATLKPNKLKHSVAKQTDASGNIQKGHVIEMSGPILPHHVLNVSHLLRDLQEEDFTLTFNTHEPTASLNLRGTLLQSDPCKEVEASGLHPKAEETLSSVFNLRDNTVYKEVTSTHHGFSFNL
ncbi:LOW QUALITY PROTEIN: protein downstream neighbor of son homolog [Haliotis rubra]|uniref:LOW QUALITY PROTEIN: protein downstream neighbor of son homolog n=1 Tax=Haliotis rubra TaxID=36100 RepID=UPI001EE58C16|nr:LOW QUALITY PROTEIN: protein downstream neighbor of son homolog [Haliotis rubra]